MRFLHLQGVEVGQKLTRSYRTHDIRLCMKVKTVEIAGGDADEDAAAAAARKRKRERKKERKRMEAEAAASGG